MVEIVNVNSEKPIINLTKGIVTVPDGSVGIAQDRGQYVLLGPGMHQWDSPTFKWDKLKVLSNEQVLQGPSLARIEADAEANAIMAIAKAQEEAGKRLGDSETTASKLAQIAATGAALKNTSSTVYFSQAGQTPNLLLQQSSKV